VRLTKTSIVLIRKVVHEMCGQADVWLFGSRVDDHKKGGDIDLYIETTQMLSMPQRIRLASRLQRAIGERKIDIIMNMPDSIDRPIFQTAKDTGIRL